jgi:hypothetical protein
MGLLLDDESQKQFGSGFPGLQVRRLTPRDRIAEDPRRQSRQAAIKDSLSARMTARRFE